MNILLPHNEGLTRIKIEGDLKINGKTKFYIK